MFSSVRLLAGALGLAALVSSGICVGWVHPAAYQSEYNPRASDHDALAQRHCLALNVYHEARSEPPEGQFAVALVTLNRVRDPRFPGTICRVVWQRGQFSWTHDGKPDRPYESDAWRDALWMANLAWWHEQFSPAGIATHFHTVDIRPAWAGSKRPVGRVGRHVFYVSSIHAR